jgi:hypothetical protein
MFALAQGKAFDKAMSGLRSSVKGTNGNGKPNPTVAQWQEFLNLTAQLSPENLTCDGELSRSQVVQKKRRLDAQWATLEKTVGRKVTEDEVWAANMPPKSAASVQQTEKRRSR